jgi:hypothetical protein
MAGQIIASWSQERFPMVIDDPLTMPGTGTIVAEGAGLFPEKVAPHLSDPRAAIWLVASAEFIRHVRNTRGEGVTALTSNRQQAFENLVARDVLMAQHVRRQAEERGLTVVNVDGDSIADVARTVERHFAPLLDAPRRARPERTDHD